uniref:Uncharacterized protein n=1 Tax=Heterorhabditis bacteriophora TaxID=37862 RepID=A0A1I7WW13_HETBA
MRLFSFKYFCYLSCIPCLKRNIFTLNYNINKKVPNSSTGKQISLIFSIFLTFAHFYFTSIFIN